MSISGDMPDDAPADLRTRGQKQHDALANALSVAASSALLPTVGGAAPTLIVSVRADDVIQGNGYAHVEGCDVPVSIAAALHTGALLERGRAATIELGSLAGSLKRQYGPQRSPTRAPCVWHHHDGGWRSG